MSRLLSLFALWYGAMTLGSVPVPRVEPLPLPKTLRIEGAGPRGKVWERLKPNEKEFAFHLMEAAHSGRKLLFYQTHRHSLALREALLAAFSISNIAATKKQLGEEPFRELLIYAAKFLDACGPYGPSNRKFILTKVSAGKVDSLLTSFLPKSAKGARPELVRLLTDPAFETRQFPESPDGAGLEEAGGNLYQRGIKGSEVKAALAKGLDSKLNCRVVKKGKKLSCDVLTVNSPGVVGEVLGQVVHSLTKASALALTETQRQQVDAFIQYFKSGNIDDFRAANIAWVKDRAHSTVDFMLGWVEVYEDWLARIGSWESYVQVLDPEVTRKAELLAKSAQYFEDGMPYGEFKKKFPAEYSPPAIMAYYLQEIASYRSAGYNLPNFDDIRRDVGAKNVIRLPFPGEDTDPELHAAWEEVLKEFLPADKVADTLKNRELIKQNIVLMHEIIGHGSGTFDAAKFAKGEDPVSALGSLGSALEEQRADLAALFYLGDKKLVELGIYKDAAEAKRVRDLGYDYYLADFLRRLSGQRTLAEAHQRGHWLFIRKLLDAKAIAWVAKDGKSPATIDNQVLAVRDYEKFHATTREVLAELQRIKATRDEAGLRELFAKQAPLEAASEPWAVAVIRRGTDLKINAGYVEQPWRVTADGKYQSFGGQTLESIAPFWDRFQ